MLYSGRLGTELWRDDQDGQLGTCGIGCLGTGSYDGMEDAGSGQADEIHIRVVRKGFDFHSQTLT